MAFATPSMRVTQYMVQPDDTLDSVAKQFAIIANINQDAFLAFREGIVENNYHLFANGRKLQKDDVVIINYWEFE